MRTLIYVSNQLPKTDVVYNVNENVKPVSNLHWVYVSCKIFWHFISHFICRRVRTFAFYSPPVSSQC